MEKMIDDLSDQIKKRTYSPLIVYFVIAWLLHNHQVISTILDQGYDPIEKSGMLATRFSSWWDMLWWPLIHSFGVFLLWCFVQMLSSVIWDFSRHVTLLIQQRIRDIKPVYTQGAMDSVRDEYDAKIKAISSEANSLSSQNRTLLKEKEKAEDSVVEINIKYTKKIDELNLEIFSLENKIKKEENNIRALAVVSSFSNHEFRKLFTKTSVMPSKIYLFDRERIEMEFGSTPNFNDDYARSIDVAGMIGIYPMVKPGSPAPASPPKPPQEMDITKSKNFMELSVRGIKPLGEIALK